MKSRTYQIIQLNIKDLNKVIKGLKVFIDDARFYYEAERETKYSINPSDIGYIFKYLKYRDPQYLEYIDNPYNAYLDKQKALYRAEGYTSTELGDYVIRANHYVSHQISKHINNTIKSSQL